VIKVLFVDDEPNVLNGIRRTLLNFPDRIEASFAASGDDALLVMEQNQAEVIVTDIAMPGLDGRALIIELYKRYPDVVPIVLSGHWSNSIAMSELGSSVQFLAKPVKSKQLLDAIFSAAQAARLVSAPLAIAAPRSDGEGAASIRSDTIDWVNSTSEWQTS